MDNKIILSFTHTAKGLIAKEGDLWGFTISEDGKTFFPAKAEIKNNTVVVFNENVRKPKAVRYAFINNAAGNLFNNEGLPASPFRTDVD
jgi:sialate O-acetylesterase